MIDDIVGLAVAASTDVAINKAAKRHRWVRVFQAAIGLLFFALLVALLYVTVNNRFFLKTHLPATPVLLWSQRHMLEGHRSMRVTGRSWFSLAARSSGFLSGARPTVAAQFRPASELVSWFVLQSHAEKTAPSSSQWSNPALNLAPFSRWTLRDKAAQRRLALR